MQQEETNVGVLAIDVYFPSSFVRQEKLEEANGVSKGKYSIGLGQDAMAFTGDLEDINSVALTVVQSLMEKYDISPTEVGRMEVGTESLVDKSKSTKTVLMSLFAGSGNTDIEGATVINACYGGTAALLNALTWADSSSWDGRYAIVVAADIAVYADGPARPTGGCGAVAMLVGRNAPLKIDLKSRASHASDVWDFFKPNMDSEYPVVNGMLSQMCFLRALDDCYAKFCEKSAKKCGKSISVRDTDYFLFHSPYNKLVQKSFARLVYQDVIQGKAEQTEALTKWMTIPAESTYEDKALETALKGLSAPLYKEKVAIGCELSKQIGNTYTAAVYMNLACIVSALGPALLGKIVTLFSYGSGALATMLSIVPREPHASAAGGDPKPSKFSLAAMQAALKVADRLAAREELTPEDLNTALQSRERSHGAVPFRPTFSPAKLFPGTFYLQEISGSYERVYARKPLDSPLVIGAPLVAVGEENGAEVGITLDDDEEEGDLMPAIPPPAPKIEKVGSGSIQRSTTTVWASGRPNVKVVVTGVAAALPGRNSDVLTPAAKGGVSAGVRNIQRIIEGHSCITPIPDAVKDAMLEKNVIELVKSAEGSSQNRVDSYEKTINVAATLGNIDLTAYGIAKSIASTMDAAVQVSIAAGLEALKDAGIVTGNIEGGGTSGWVLPVSMQATTGIVYATSFPALDTAIEEVARFFKSSSTAKSTLSSQTISDIFSELRKKMLVLAGKDHLSTETEAALTEIETFVLKQTANDGVSGQGDIGTLGGAGREEEEVREEYEFDRKFLFRVLVLGNAQLAQIVKARGPNMQTNAACAGSTQAVALAYDMIQVGRAERMIVIAGDSASSDTLMPWLGNGFRVLGAATTCADLSKAAVPFNAERSGMILGSGGIGMILESEDGARRRFAAAKASGAPTPRDTPFRCRLLGTLFTNSAYHGAAMDRKHIAEEMERFVGSVERELGISRKEIAAHGVYFSHETSTHASPASSCSANEIFGLRKVFGADLKNLVILNTKGFTGHPMGVSFEDVVAAEVLCSNKIPPIANFTESDPLLGADLNMSRGGTFPNGRCRYAMRFAAGFGSQIALALYGAADV